MSRGDDRPAFTALRFVAAALLLAAVVSLGATTAASAAAPAAAGQDQTTTTQPPDQPGIIPEPNSGHEPTDAGDRGGSLQTLLFGLIIVAVVGGGYLVHRESRKARERRGF